LQNLAKGVVPGPGGRLWGGAGFRGLDREYVVYLGHDSLDSGVIAIQPMILNYRPPVRA